jgi:hypothetical protein
MRVRIPCFAPFLLPEKQLAGICTDTTSPGSCSHRTVIVNLDGTPITVHMHETDAATPLTTEEKEQLIRLTIRRLNAVSSVTLANLLNRVCVGDEATNVKCYTLFGPGITLTKTNIGTAYVNILTELNGGRTLVDFTGCTQFRVILNGQLPGVGQHGVRIVKDSDSTVLFENATVAAQAGERELDSDWQSIPSGFTTETLVRAQAKSTTGTDDPVYRRLVLLVK